MPEAMPRRKYYTGKCQDCGHEKSVTDATFWATGLKHTVCAKGLRAYRRVINNAPLVWATDDCQCSAFSPLSPETPEYAEALAGYQWEQASERHISIETPAEPETPFDLCTCGHARNCHAEDNPTPFGRSGRLCVACKNSGQFAVICQRFELAEPKTAPPAKLTLAEAVAAVELAENALARAVANLKEAARR